MTEAAGDFPQEPIKPTGWYFEPPDEPQETLRDKLAGMAMSGVLSDPDYRVNSSEERDRLAVFCYQMADAMMKARGEG